MLIQLFTIPLVAYSYYEIPVYAMLINLFVLAVVNGLLGLTVLGVIVGMAFFCLRGACSVWRPVAGCSTVTGFCVRFPLKIPGAQRITGKPAHIRIFWYYLGLGVFLLAIYACARRNEKHKDCRETADLCVKPKKETSAGHSFFLFYCVSSAFSSFSTEEIV